MKKRKINKKLNLNKRTVSHLDNKTLNSARGGLSGGDTCESYCYSCNSCDPTCGPRRTVDCWSTECSFSDCLCTEYC